MKFQLRVGAWKVVVKVHITSSTDHEDDLCGVNIRSIVVILVQNRFVQRVAFFNTTQIDHDHDLKK